MNKNKSNLLSPVELRDLIIRAHGMASENYIQSDTEMRRRIAVMLTKAIQRDDIMKGFLGFGGPMAERDILLGNGKLEE